MPTKKTAPKNNPKDKKAGNPVLLALTLLPLASGVLLLGAWALDITLAGTLDSQSGMWVIRTRCLEAILPVSGGMSFSQEIKTIALTQKGLRARELSVPFPNNARAGKSKLRLWHDGLDNLKQALLLGRRLRERQT